MEVHAISNTDESALREVLNQCLGPAKVLSVRAAVSFLMHSGTEEIKGKLKKLIGSGTSVHFLFGDDFNLTQSAAIDSLMRLGCDLSLYVGDSNYHPKLWIIELKDGHRTVILGSSNLSRGGLVANAEANVMLHGSIDELAAFDTVWKELHDQSREFTLADLESYIDAEKAAATPPPETWKTVGKAVGAIKQHVKRWQRFIADSQKLNQHEKWRGWYLVPEHGQLDDAKLRELHKILQGVKKRPEYVRNGTISLGTDPTGLANVGAILRDAGLRGAKSQTEAQSRKNFTRQQRLYLVNLKWLEQESGQLYRITDAGEKFLRAQTAPQRKKQFTEALSRVKWPFGPISYYPFLLEVTKRVPNERIYLDELDLIVIHSYHWAEAEGIANLVTAYRGLPETDRKTLNAWADTRLRNLLAKHGGKSAYGHYRNKVADLLVAFGNTSPLAYKAAAKGHEPYIYRSR